MSRVAMGKGFSRELV